MNDREWYQDIPKGHTAMIYGEVSEIGPPRHVQAYFGQEAYEMLQMQIYMKELLRVEDEPDYLCWSPGFGLLWAAMEVLATSARFRSPQKNEKLQLEEIGSTLFATINKLIKARSRYGGSFDPEGLRYVGIEPSKIFARTAELLHPAVEVHHYADWTDLPTVEAPVISRSYQATSYAFRTTRDLCSWVFRSHCSLHGLWFSPAGDDHIINAHGKRLALFSLNTLCSEAKDRGYTLTPVSSERYSFGEHEFIAAFVLLRQFDRRQNLHFADLCSRHANFGIDGFSPSGVDDPIDWIQSKASHRGSHAGYIEPSPVPQSQMFNFGNEGVASKFKTYLERLVQ